MTNNKQQSLNEILEELYNTESEYNQIIDKLIAPHFHYKDDLLQEICLSYLSNKNKVQKAIDEGYFKYYFIMTVKNNVHSSTSPFHKNIRLNNKVQVEQDVQIEEIIDEYGMEYKLEMDEKYEQAKQLRKNVKMNYFESEMMRLYFDENMTYRAIAEEYDINHTLVFLTVQNVLERIKKQIH